MNLVTGPASVPIQRLLDRLTQVRRTGSSWTALCPAHDDRTPSLSVREGEDGRALVKCHAGCAVEAICEALGLGLPDLFRPSSGEARGDPSAPHATPQRSVSAGCTLADYASAKKLPIEFLRVLGLTDRRYPRVPAVRMPYRGIDGREVAVRFRTALTGPDRFRWASGSKPQPYGLDRLDLARRGGFLCLVEGESDAHTLWNADVPALGLPGANTWREEWARLLDGIPIIYVVIEPDAGGASVQRWLTRSALRERARLVYLDPHKDPSELYLADPQGFRTNWERALARSESLADRVAVESKAAHEDAWMRCADLARSPRILDRVAEQLERQGLVGETRGVKLLYLIVTSRLLAHPVSAGVKGPSSAGKSFVVQQVLTLFPPEAYYALSAMSERALVYSAEPLAHRVLVLYEAAGMNSDFTTYLLRSLLSENRLRYETVEKTRDGMQPRLIEREGPTSLLVTTTAANLHPENETRLLSIPVTDTQEQTRLVLKALADETERPAPDFTAWHALQTWLETGDHRVTVPYAAALMAQIPPVGLRLRRDAQKLLSLVQAHALLHQATRPRDAAGRTIATLEDYAVVYELVADLLGDTLGTTVKPETRETVEAVRALLGPSMDEHEVAGVSVTEVGRKLGLDKSSASRRVQVAVEQGFLTRLEGRRGSRAQLVLEDPLPEERKLLPTPEALSAVTGEPLRGCTDGGGEAPLSPPDGLAMNENADERANGTWGEL